MESYIIIPNIDGFREYDILLVTVNGYKNLINYKYGLKYLII